MQVWIDGVLVENVVHTWRFWDSLKIDGVWFYDHFNKDWMIPAARDLTSDYTNFKVSEKRIYEP